MTGICGWLGKDSSTPAQDLLQSMATGIPGAPGQTSDQHTLGDAAAFVRSWPDSTHLFSDEEFVVAIDGTLAWSDDTLRTIAETNGHAAAVAAGYRRYGTKFLAHLHGAFALAILSPNRRKGLVAIDRMGIHGMCYALSSGGALVFGSTADAVKAHDAIPASISTQSILNYLCFYTSPAPDTVYREQKKLLAAECLIFDEGKIRTETYWEVPYRDDCSGDGASLQEELGDLIDKAVRNACSGYSGQEVGAFLSGGLDSTTVCGFLSQVYPEPAKCFTIAFDEAEYDESSYAKIAQRHFGLEHHLHTLGVDDAVSFLSRFAAAYDEPYGNSSAIPAFYCAQLAAQTGTKMLLAGDGGDELFAGNERYISQGVYDHYSRIPSALRSLLIEPITGAIPDSAPGLIGKAKRYVRRSRMPMPKRIYSFNPLISASVNDLFEPEVAGCVNADHPFDLLSLSYNAVPDDTDRVRRMMRLDMQITLADNDLRKVVRMCELAGQRVAFPLLDEAIVEFAAKIPTRVLLQDGVLRGFYKAAMADFLPSEILNKPKHGFGMPFDPWLHGDKRLHELGVDSLRSFGQRGYLRSDVAQGLVNDFINGRPNLLTQIVWDIMMLEQWLQSRNVTAFS